MTARFSIGDKVKWKWGAHWAHGTITECYTRRVTRTIKGSEITLNADDNDPAYMVEQQDGDRALKSHSQLHHDGG